VPYATTRLCKCEHEDNDMKHLDEQMQAWSTRFRDDLQIDVLASHTLATTIAAQVAQLPTTDKQRVIQATPVLPSERLDELKAFQAWMDTVSAMRWGPAVTRAQVITQNYMCFIYLKDSCFEVLKEVAPPGSTLQKCCAYLVRPPIRDFRNAVAHANWRYKPDFSGLEYWAQTGSGKRRRLSRFEVSQQELDFWQCLARAVAYAAFLNL